MEKFYKCRAAPEKHWTLVLSTSPVFAAETYAEEHGLKRGDIVSVWGIGKFMVLYYYYEPAVHLKQLTGIPYG